MHRTVRFLLLMMFELFIVSSAWLNGVRVRVTIRIASEKRLDNNSIQFFVLSLFTPLCTFLFGLFGKESQKTRTKPFRNFKLITVYYCVYLSLTIFVLKQHLKGMFDLVFSFFDFQCVSSVSPAPFFPGRTLCRGVVFALLF